MPALATAAAKSCAQNTLFLGHLWAGFHSFQRVNHEKTPPDDACLLMSMHQEVFYILSNGGFFWWDKG